MISRILPAQKGIRVFRPAVLNYFRGGSRVNHRALDGPVDQIPDRHSEDLFVGVRVEGFKRQSAFRNRDKRPTQRA